MKNKIVSLFAMSLLSNIACAYDTPTPVDLVGVKVVKSSEVNLPYDMKEKIIKNEIALKKNGYIYKKDDHYFNYLYHMRDEAKEQFKLKPKPGVYDTYMKKNISDLQLAFKYSGLTFLTAKNIISYAVMGGYQQEKNKPEGWTGVRTFFEMPYGMCSYSYNKIVNAVLDEATVEYFVPNRPGHKLISGNLNAGFIYIVEWYGDDNINEIECINKKLDKTILTKVVELANKIDKNVTFK